MLLTNKNPISYEWPVRNNMQNCQMKLSEYDRRWFGKFVYQDRELNKKWQMVTRAKYSGGNLSAMCLDSWVSAVSRPGGVVCQ